MTLIDGDRIITAQLYDDEHEEFIEKKMSIIDYVNAYTDEGVTIADDVLDKIKGYVDHIRNTGMGKKKSLEFIEKFIEGVKAGKWGQGMTREEMTREEAKRIAQGLITDFKCESETMVEFCNVVIKALEQEPCEDAISGKNCPIKHISNEDMYIPYLMHKEMDIPIAECQKAYNIAMEYLRNKSKLKG